MRVYQPGKKGRQTHYIQPGHEFPTSYFLDENGKAKLFAIKFIEGMAEVDTPIGEYMIDKKIARSSPILLLGD